MKDLEEEISAIKTDISFVMENLIAINSVLAAMTLGAPPYSINLKGNVEKYVEQITGKINSELRRLRALNELGCVLGDKSVVSSNVFVS